MLSKTFQTKNRLKTFQTKTKEKKQNQNKIT